MENKSITLPWKTNQRNTFQIVCRNTKLQEDLKQVAVSTNSFSLGNITFFAGFAFLSQDKKTVAVAHDKAKLIVRTIQMTEMEIKFEQFSILCQIPRILKKKIQGAPKKVSTFKGE